jgi:hypothetical protein
MSDNVQCRQVCHSQVLVQNNHEYVLKNSINQMYFLKKPVKITLYKASKQRIWSRSNKKKKTREYLFFYDGEVHLNIERLKKLGQGGGRHVVRLQVQLLDRSVAFCKKHNAKEIVKVEKNCISFTIPTKSLPRVWARLEAAQSVRQVFARERSVNTKQRRHFQQADTSMSGCKPLSDNKYYPPRSRFGNKNIGK